MPKKGAKPAKNSKKSHQSGSSPIEKLKHHLNRKSKTVITSVAAVSFVFFILPQGTQRSLESYSTLNMEEPWSPEKKHKFKGYKMLPSAPNKKFVFHNKLPKCGSTTMNDLVQALAIRNGFHYMKTEPVMKFDENEPLAASLEGEYKEPFFLMQHHYWLDFKQFGYKQPTVINVVREPVAWFSSHYHFKLYGWNRLKGHRPLGKQEFIPLEDCIKEEADQCVKNTWRYIEFFAGAHLDKLNYQKWINMNWKLVEGQKAKAVQMIKKMVLNTDYFVVGVLEQFEDTLELFEYMLPDYYTGALAEFKSNKDVQDTVNGTKSVNNKPLTEETHHKFKTEVLNWESDLYDFIRALFNHRYRAMKGY